MSPADRLRGQAYQEDKVAEEKHEETVVAKSNFNVAGIIAAIALLLLVLGILKFAGVSPI